MTDGAALTRRGERASWHLLPRVAADSDDPEQQAEVARFLRARGLEGSAVPELFAMLFASPLGAGRLGDLTEHCRFHSSLDRLQREVALLAACYVHGFTYEIEVHEPLALEAGMSLDELESLREGRWPELATSIAVVGELATAFAAGSPLEESAAARRAHETLTPAQIADIALTSAAYTALAALGASMMTLRT